MLFLKRRRQQSVIVGSSHGFERVLKVIVPEISRATVRLRFDAAHDGPCPSFRSVRISAGGPNACAGATQLPPCATDVLKS